MLCLRVCKLTDQAASVLAPPRPRFFSMVFHRRILPVRAPAALRTFFGAKAPHVSQLLFGRGEWENVTKVVFSFKTLLSFATISIVLDYLA